MCTKRADFTSTLGTQTQEQQTLHRYWCSSSSTAQHFPSRVVGAGREGPPHGGQRGSRHGQRGPCACACACACTLIDITAIIIIIIIVIIIIIIIVVVVAEVLRLPLPAAAGTVPIILMLLLCGACTGLGLRRGDDVNLAAAPSEAAHAAARIVEAAVVPCINI
jgi:uncharacterized integral membrane protein